MAGRRQSFERPDPLRLERLTAAYRLECAHGISTSVRKRYEWRLLQVREVLRRRPQTAARLGEALTRIEAVDEERLADALSIQRASSGTKLLGEILMDLK